MADLDADLRNAASSGASVRLMELDAHTVYPVNLQPSVNEDSSFRLVAAGGDRALRVFGAGKVDLNGKNGPYTRIEVKPVPDGGSGLWARKQEQWLTLRDGSLSASADEGQAFQAQVVQEETCNASVPPGACAVLEGDSILLQPMGDLGSFGPLRAVRKKPGALPQLVTQEGERLRWPKGESKPPDAKGAFGPWASWQLYNMPDNGVALWNSGHKKFLPPARPWAESDEAVVAAKLVQDVPAPVAAPDDTKLTDEQVRQFKEQGYIILKKALNPAKRDYALRAINCALGSPNNTVCDDEPLNINSQLKLNASFDIFSVMAESPQLYGALKHLVGPGLNNRSLADAQIAMRFPQPLSDKNTEDVKPGHVYHIDGMGNGRYRNFALLVGVALSDQSTPNRGNLHVWPGTHLREDLQTYYKDMIDNEGAGEDDRTKPNLGPSTQVLLEPCDVVIAHQLLAHRGGVNYSPDIRYQLFYRPKNKLTPRAVVESGDPWCELTI